MGRARTGQGEGARAPPDMGKELAPPLGRTSRTVGKEPYLRAPPGRREVVPVRTAGKKQRPVRGQRPARHQGGEEPDLAQPDLGPRAAGEGATAGDGAAELSRGVRTRATSPSWHAAWRCGGQLARRWRGRPPPSSPRPDERHVGDGFGSWRENDAFLGSLSPRTQNR